jgi:hypothetical protein
MKVYTRTDNHVTVVLKEKTQLEGRDPCASCYQSIKGNGANMDWLWRAVLRVLDL